MEGKLYYFVILSIMKRFSVLFFRIVDFFGLLLFLPPIIIYIVYINTNGKTVFNPREDNNKAFTSFVIKILVLTKI